jgi:hypothetical protein
MASKDDDAPAKPAKPAEPPKPVNIGGESFLDRIRPHIKQISVVLLGVVAIIAAVSVFRSCEDDKKIEATDQLATVLDIARRPIRAKDDKPDPKKPSFASEKERAMTLLATPGIDAAGPCFRAGLLVDAGKLDEAIAEYKKGGAGKAIEAVLCREGLGLALETKAAGEKDPTARQKGLEDALAAFTAMQPDETGLRRAWALYHQGRIQLLAGKRAEAKASFDAAKTANKDGDRELGDLIDKRLAMLGAS